nr:hypothetical protein [Tanacetum cinerariifolium]
MQTQESRIDTGKAVDADLVVTERNGTESEVKDDSSRSGNGTDADDADIRPIYDEKPMAEVQLTVECNIFAIGQHHTEQPKIINEGRVDQNSSKNIPRFSSNDMVHNHYLDEARKKTHGRDRNSKTSVIPSVRFQSTADGSKPKPRSTNQSTRSLPVSKSSCVMITAVPKADHSKNSRHRFSPNKTFVVYEKTSPRSNLRWKPTGRIFKYVGLRWIPTGKLFYFCTSKVDSEPPHGSNVDIPNIHECKQTLDVSAGTSINVQKERSLDLSAELESLFGPSLDEYFNGENKVVSKFSADTSDKRQQQPDLTSSTSTLATTVTADGNFDL